MPTLTINIPVGAVPELKKVYGYLKEDGTAPTDAEIVQRIKDKVITVLKREVREHNISEAEAAARETIGEITLT